MTMTARDTCSRGKVRVATAVAGRRTGDLDDSESTDGINSSYRV